MTDMAASAMAAMENAAGIYRNGRNQFYSGALTEKQGAGRTGGGNTEEQTAVSFREYMEDAMQKGTAVLAGNNIICIITEEALESMKNDPAYEEAALRMRQLSGYGLLSGSLLSGGLSSAGLLFSGMGLTPPNLLSSGLSSAGLSALGLPLWNTGSLAKTYGSSSLSADRGALGYSGRSISRAGMVNAYKNTLKTENRRLSERR